MQCLRCHDDPQQPKLHQAETRGEQSPSREVRLDGLYARAEHQGGRGGAARPAHRHLDLPRQVQGQDDARAADPRRRQREGIQRLPRLLRLPVAGAQ